MAYFSGVIYSKSLCMDTSLGVILPHDSRIHNGLDTMKEGITPSKKPKTLILLHGLTDNWAAWPNRSSILRYAEQYDIAVLMPDAQKSWYQDMKYGPNFYTYITEELPQLAAEMYQVSVEPQDLMIAGLSMGGYGAMFCGFKNPERFLGVGSFSAAADIHELVGPNMPVRKETIGFDEECKSIFGVKREVPESSDLYVIAKDAIDNKRVPRLFMTCGNQDALLPSNEKLKEQLEAGGCKFHYETWDGVHEWGFWDVSIQKMLDYYLVDKAYK